MTFTITPGVSRLFAVREDTVIRSHHDTELDAQLAIQSYENEDRFRDLVWSKLAELYNEGHRWPLASSTMLAVFQNTMEELRDALARQLGS